MARYRHRGRGLPGHWRSRLSHENRNRLVSILGSVNRAASSRRQIRPGRRVRPALQDGKHGPGHMPLVPASPGRPGASPGRGAPRALGSRGPGSDDSEHYIWIQAAAKSGFKLGFPRWRRQDVRAKTGSCNVQTCGSPGGAPNPPSLFRLF